MYCHNLFSHSTQKSIVAGYRFQLAFCFGCSTFHNAVALAEILARDDGVDDGCCYVLIVSLPINATRCTTAGMIRCSLAFPQLHLKLNPRL